MSVRLPGNLKPRLVEAARKNGRTINAEIVNRLQDSFDDLLANALPAGAIKAILETRELVGEMHEATKAQPAAPSKQRLNRKT